MGLYSVPACCPHPVIAVRICLSVAVQCTIAVRVRPSTTCHIVVNVPSLVVPSRTATIRKSICISCACKWHSKPLIEAWAANLSGRLLRARMLLFGAPTRIAMNQILDCVLFILVINPFRLIFIFKLLFGRLIDLFVLFLFSRIFFYLLDKCRCTQNACTLRTTFNIHS